MLATGRELCEAKNVFSNNDTRAETFCECNQVIMTGCLCAPSQGKCLEFSDLIRKHHILQLSRYSFITSICTMEFQPSDISEQHKHGNRLTINNNLQQCGCKEAPSCPATPQYEKRWQYFFKKLEKMGES